MTKRKWIHESVSPTSFFRRYEKTSWMQCVRSFITRKLLNIWSWQVFWLAPSSMPSHSARNSGLRDFEDTFGAYSSGVCSGFSPDSLFTHHLKNRGNEHQIQRQIYGVILNMQVLFQRNYWNNWIDRILKIIGISSDSLCIKWLKWSFPISLALILFERLWLYRT